MKKIAVLAIALISCFASWGVEISGVEGRVDIESGCLNFRIRPEMTAPVAVRLPKGTVVRIIKTHGNWAEVSAPAEMALFVAESNVIGGRAFRDTNLRLHADIKSPVAGTLKKGETVSVVAGGRYGWVKVLPPERIRVYAVKLYLSYDESALAAMAVKPENTVEKPTVVAIAVDKSAEKPAVKAAAKSVEKPVVKSEKITSAKQSVPVKKFDVKEVKPAAKPGVVSATVKKVEAKSSNEKSIAEVKQTKAPVKPVAEKKKEIAKPQPKPAAVSNSMIYSGEICGSTRDALLAVGIQKNDKGKDAVFAGTVTKFQASSYMVTDWYLSKNDGALDCFIIPAGGSLNFNRVEGRRVKIKGKSFVLKDWKHAIVVVNEVIEEK